ncbi:MAG: glycosyltransferase [Deltaproteobacteria bacterium]|nr:glycosyltransferase [Deltaproteobacteria bacterium]
MRSPAPHELPPPPPGKDGWPWTAEEILSPGEPPDSRGCPRISIVTPSFNQGLYLEEAIRSVLLQGYPDLEYIIIDGCSKDQSIDIIRKYSPWIKYWVSEPDRGQSHAINKGFEKASGLVFGWLNSDDILAPRALMQLIALREENPDAVAWVGACKDVDAEGNFLRKRLPRPGSQRQFANWSRDAWIPQPSCLFDAKTFRDVGLLDESLHYVMDVDLWMRLARKGRFASTNEIISFARMYDGIKSRKDIPMQQAEHILICFRQGLPQVARTRMSQCMTFALDAWPYRRLLPYFIKRTLLWSWHCFRRFCGR